MGYTTQMNAARQKIVTKEMQAVAAWEGIGMDRLLKLVANGQAVIPANKNHKCLKPFGIGSALKTKINVNLGTSRDCMNMDAVSYTHLDVYKRQPPAPAPDFPGSQTRNKRSGQLKR